MEFLLKEYGDYKYIEYLEKEKNLAFNNAEYFVFALNDVFDKIMRGVGGFVATMTSRYVEELHEDITKIALCCTPHANDNFFHFQFAYIDKDENVVAVEWDNNYFDYEYFKKKFKDCTMETGFVFDLIGNPKWELVTREIGVPATNFPYLVNDKPICWNDVLICDDLSLIFKEEYLNNIKKANGKYVEISLALNHSHFIHFEIKIVNEVGNYLFDSDVYGGEDDMPEICVSHAGLYLFKNLKENLRFKN